MELLRDPISACEGPWAEGGGDEEGEISECSSLVVSHSSGSDEREEACSRRTSEG